MNFVTPKEPTMNRRFAVVWMLIMMTASAALSQQFVPNYDESKIPKYELPDPLKLKSGESVKDADSWRSVRRAEVLDLFAAHVFGRSPAPIAVQASLVSSVETFSGKAVRREFDLTLSRGDKSITMGLLVYTPKGKSKVRTFLGLNFQGNHALENDPGIRIPTTWMRERKGDDSVANNRATEKGRGADSTDWPVEMIVSRGYGLATIYYGDIDPDFDDGFKNGIHPLFSDWGDSVPANERWGSIAAWAYGLSRALDFLETDSLVDGSQVAVIGHSRLGKTALWAGAADERFKFVISNNSGCGGAALSRRAIGETVGRINQSFPHWFCLNHRQYNENESALPVDHHELIALMAPRPVYVASASEDKWADPKGEFLSCVHADPVYRLLGTTGMGGQLPPTEMPANDQPIQQGIIGYHIRTGAHAMTPVDWQYYLDFADKHWAAGR